MKILILILGTICSLSCTNQSPRSSENTIPKRELLANQISLQTAKLLESKKLTFIGIGSSTMDDVSMMALSFDSTRPLGEVSDARKLIVECAELYLREINSNREIRPFLHQYPFGIENIEIVIFTSSKISSSTVCGISVRCGKIKYMKPVGNSFDTLMIESYADALKKLAEEKNHYNLYVSKLRK